jgi:hypothetical protein
MKTPPHIALRFLLTLATLTLSPLLAPPDVARAQPFDDDTRRPMPNVDTTLEEALAAYAHEPTVERVVAAAVHAAELSPTRAREAAQRARLSGWLPTARAGIRRGTGRDLALQSTDLLDRTNLTTDDSLSVDAALVFRLDRLVFAREEVPLLREERALVEERDALVRDVVHLYFERRRLQLERDLLGRRGPVETVRIAELTALLDALTRGAFARHTTRRTRAR